MTPQDLLIGLDDAAKICEVHTPKSKHLRDGSWPAEVISPETFNHRRAAEACRLAARRLEKIQRMSQEEFADWQKGGTLWDLTL
jgi:hypothetical protein